MMGLYYVVADWTVPASMRASNAGGGERTKQHESNEDAQMENACLGVELRQSAAHGLLCR